MFFMEPDKVNEGIGVSILIKNNYDYCAALKE